jgi:hypothetical protein
MSLIDIGFVIAAALYFVPTIIAVVRHHPHALPIGLVNLLLGWTLLGWIGVLIWSCITVQRRPSH